MSVAAAATPGPDNAASFKYYSSRRSSSNRRRDAWPEYPEYEVEDYDRPARRKDYDRKAVDHDRKAGDYDKKDYYDRRRDYDAKDYIRRDPYYYRDNGGYDYGPIDRMGIDNRADYGYGHGHKKECCPLVVKPLVVLATLGAIAAATAFFNVLITMNIGRKRRRRRRSLTHAMTLMDSLWLGMSIYSVQIESDYWASCPKESMCTLGACMHYENPRITVNNSILVYLYRLSDQQQFTQFVSLHCHKSDARFQCERS